MSDSLARLITIGVAAVLIVLTAYHRTLARRAARAQPGPGAAPASPRAEGRIVWLRAVGLLIWASLIGYFVDPGWMAWSRLAVPRFVPWLGAAILIVSVPALRWVLHHLGPNLTSDIAPRASHQLVTTGPYRWVRHPWYAALLLFLVGLALLWSSWLLALCTLARAIYFVARSRIEESNLIGFFGDAYRDYARGVPGFVPQLGGSPRDR